MVIKYKIDKKGNIIWQQPSIWAAINSNINRKPCKFGGSLFLDNTEPSSLIKRRCRDYPEKEYIASHKWQWKNKVSYKKDNDIVQTLQKCKAVLFKKNDLGMTTLDEYRRQIHEMTAASTGVDKTSGTVRFKSADETAVDTNNRITIPAASTTYSYTKQVRFYFSTGPSVDITNLRAYTDGTNNFGTGIGVQYDLSDSWATNVYTDIAGTSLFTKTSGSPIDLDAINTGPHTGTGYKGDFLRMQMTVASTANPGTLSSEVLSFAYDET